VKPSLFLFAAAAVTLAACGGKVIVDTGTGTGAGGTGGAGGSSSTVLPSTSSGVPHTNSVVTVGVTVGPMASVTTGTGTNTCNPSLTCADVISGNGSANELCPGSAADQIFNKFEACICAGNCQVQCGANVCINQPASMPCKQCIGSPSGCNMQFTDCANN
jgi:hypothetical protein